MADGAGPSAIIVGAGLMGTWHARTLGRLGIGIRAIVDPDTSRATRLARGLSRCDPHASLEAALDRTPADVVHVCTPIDSHVALVTAALRAGKHVIAEKPLARNYADTRSLLDLARAKDLFLCPVHQFPFQKGFRLAAAQARQAGPILHVDSVACSAGADGGSDDLRAEVARDILPHPLSLMRRLLGGRLPGSWHVARGAPGEIRAMGQCGGVSLAILVSMSGRPTRNTLRIICERASFHVDLFHGFSVREAGAVSRSRKVARPFSVSATTLWNATTNLAGRALRREHAYPGLRHLFGAFYDALAAGGSCPIHPDEVTGVAAAREVIVAGLR